MVVWGLLGYTICEYLGEERVMLILKCFGLASKRSLHSGFTLIELLVVVLVIGILAAVAVPQYQLSILKTRLAAVRPILKAVAEAQDRLYISTGSYTTNFSDLDVELPADTTVEGSNMSWASFGSGHYQIMLQGAGLGYEIQAVADLKGTPHFFLLYMPLYGGGLAHLRGRLTCWATRDTVYAKACASMAGQPVSSPAGANGNSVYWFVDR